MPSNRNIDFERILQVAGWLGRVMMIAAASYAGASTAQQTPVYINANGGQTPLAIDKAPQSRIK